MDCTRPDRQVALEIGAASGGHFGGLSCRLRHTRADSWKAHRLRAIVDHPGRKANPECIAPFCVAGKPDWDRRRRLMLRRSILQAVAALALLAAPTTSWAEDSVKIGLILPMTGQQASTGKQISAAVRLYQQEH